MLGSARARLAVTALVGLDQALEVVRSAIEYDVAPTVLRLLGTRPHLLQADGRILDEALVAPAGTQR